MLKPLSIPWLPTAMPFEFSAYGALTRLTPRHDVLPCPPPREMQMMGMLPGFSADMMPGGGGADADKQQQLQIKRHITIIESMTEKELDSTNVKFLQVPPLHTVLHVLPPRAAVLLPNLPVLSPPRLPGFDEGNTLFDSGDRGLRTWTPSLPH